MTHDQKQIQDMLTKLRAMEWPHAFHDKFEDAVNLLEEVKDCLEDEFGNPIEPAPVEPSFERAAR